MYIVTIYPRSLAAEAGEGGAAVFGSHKDHEVHEDGKGPLAP